jgi:type IV secretory pathway VirB2 component (pilin)
MSTTNSSTNKSKNRYFLETVLVLLPIIIAVTPAHAEGGEAIQIGGLENLLWSIAKTVQLYTLPIMAIALAFMGVKLVMSGDDSSSKADIKSSMIRIIIGAFIVFGAATIASILKSTLS